MQTGSLAGTRSAYNECAVQIGLDEARRHRPAEHPLAAPSRVGGSRGAEIPAVGRRASSRFATRDRTVRRRRLQPPDVIVQVVDATALEHHLELTLKLAKFGRPLVIALNKMDEAVERGIYVNAPALSARLGVPVVPTAAIKGHGIAESVPRGGARRARRLVPACAAAERAHHRGAGAARVALEHAGNPAGLPRAAAIARDADRGRRSVFSRRIAAALSRVPAGSCGDGLRALRSRCRAP